MPNKPMMWIAYDPMVPDYTKNREQFNGEEPAWGESIEEFMLNQNVDVPQIGDQLSLRMGLRRVYERRLERPEIDGDGVVVSPYYWTVLVK